MFTKAEDWIKRNKSEIGSFFFTWLPSVTSILICAIYLFPWGDITDKTKKLSEVFSERDAITSILFISYAIVIAKNNYDLNQKISKRIEQISLVTADSFLIVRNELESLQQILKEANTICFSGGHLSTVIIGHSDELYNYLQADNEARFILPNPINQDIISQYAEKLMVGMTPEEFKQMVIMSLKTITRYKAEGLKIDVRVYNYIPSFGLQVIEAKTGNRIYVELYTLQTQLSERLLFPISQSDSGEMYLRFKNQFRLLWNDSKEIDNVQGLQDLLK